MWDLIASQNVTLHKKVDLDITMREFTRYLSLVQAHAILCNRTTTTDADFIAIDQFLTYSKPMINSTDRRIHQEGVSCAAVPVRKAYDRI